MSKKAHEPLLTENPDRFVMFPISDIDIWKSYKKHMDCFWRAEEIACSIRFLLPTCCRFLLRMPLLPALAGIIAIYFVLILMI